MALLLTADGSGLQRVGRGLAFAGTAGPSFDTDAATYIAAVEAADGQALEAATQTAINTFIVGCKADGNWSAIKASCILAGARTLSGALVPLAGPAPTNNNFVSADYNRKTGLIGDGATKYLNSNRLNSADPQNSKHICVYATVAPSITGQWRSLMGSLAVTGIGRSDIEYSTTYTGYAQNANSNNQSTYTAKTAGFIGVSRNSSSSQTARSNGTNASSSSSSAAGDSNNIYVFCRNLNVPDQHTNPRLSFYSIGEAVDLALLDARVTTLMADLATATPWTPADISSVTAWWDASDSSTVTYSSGTSVSSWASKVGSYALTQSTASKQPSRSGAINGLAAVVFDGVNDGMSVNNFDMTPGGQAFSIWAVATAADNTSDMVLAEHSTNYNGNNGAFIFYRTSGKKVQLGKRGSGTWASWETLSSFTTTPSLIVGVHDGTLSTDESKTYFNGALDGSALSGFNSDTSSNNISATLYVGSRNNSDLYLNGQICEMGFVTSALTITERQKLEGYLAHKWGFAASLPSGHPYKNSAP